MSMHLVSSSFATSISSASHPRVFMFRSIWLGCMELVLHLSTYRRRAHLHYTLGAELRWTLTIAPLFRRRRRTASLTISTRTASEIFSLRQTICRICPQLSEHDVQRYDASIGTRAYVYGRCWRGLHCMECCFTCLASRARACMARWHLRTDRSSHHTHMHARSV